MIQPGPRNLITDVDGLLVGNAADETARSGVTVLVLDPPALVAVDQRGGGPGTRETDALEPTCMVDRVDAIVLSGGSVFGLDAASGVTQGLAKLGRGFAVGPHRVPIVPAAILFDLGNGGDKNWDDEPPYRHLGRRALEAAARDFALGNEGAGFGAAAGRIKGGLGSASAIDPDSGLAVGALVAANPVGSVLWPGSTRLLAAGIARAAEIGQQPVASGEFDLDLPGEGRIGGHTCIGVVATNLKLDKGQAKRIAMMAHDGLARAIRPVHTPMDGDTIFSVSTGRLDLPATPQRIARIGAIAADCVTRAVARAIVEAATLGSLASYRDMTAGD